MLRPWGHEAMTWGHELHWVTRETTCDILRLFKLSILDSTWWTKTHELKRDGLTTLDPLRDFRARFAANTCRASRFKSKVTRKVRLAECPLARRWSKQPRPAPCGGNYVVMVVRWWWSWVDMQRLRKFKWWLTTYDICMTFVWPVKAEIFRFLLYAYAAGSTGAFCFHSCRNRPPLNRLWSSL